MDSGFGDKFLPFLRQFWIPIVLCVAGVIFLGYGLIGYLVGGNLKDGSADADGEILFEAASTSRKVTDDSKSDKREDGIDKMLVVDIAGAVEKPGVYTLPADARVQDVLIKAGGMAEDADREQVAKGLNLAARVVDGEKIYIPFSGERLAQGGAGDSGVILGAETEGQISLNRGSESELDSLPGVGKVTVEKIIANRPYSSIEELMEKKVVGKKVFEDIRDKIRVD